MSANSSTSGSKRNSRVYLANLLGVAVAVLLANAAVSLYAIRTNTLDWYFADLFAYQTRKLETASPIDVLLVGDSSLGNAVDARAWSAKTGLNVVNVALTGVYGYAGSLQMIRRGVEQAGVRTVVVVQTLDMMTRPVSHEGILFTARDLSFLRDVPLDEVVPWLLSKEIPASMFKRLRKGPPRQDASRFPTDYARQESPDFVRSRYDSFAPLPAAAINWEKSYYLKQIGAYCAREGLRCLYAHGPIAAPLCGEPRAYVQGVNRIVRNAGLKLMGEMPVCLQRSQLGDSYDHAAPDAKAEVSDAYLARFLTAN